MASARDGGQTGTMPTGAGSHPQLRPNPDVVAEHLGDGIALVHLRTDRVYELNRTGARLWDLLTSGHDRVQIQRELVREFAVDEAQLAQEIEMLLSLLVAENLVIEYA